MILVVLMYMLLASTFTIAKTALFVIPPIFFVGIRMVVSGVLLLGYTYLRNVRQWSVNKRDLRFFALIVLFHIYLAYVLEFVALKGMNSAKACLMYNFSPFITALFGFALGIETLTKRKWLGLVIGFFGFAPVLYLSTPQEGSTILSFSWQEFFMLGSVVSGVIGWLVMKKLVNQQEYSPILVNGIGMFFGGLLALITSARVEGVSSWVTVFSSEQSRFIFFACAASLILITNVLFYNLYGFLLKRYSATFLSFAGFMTPLFAAIYGRIFLSEQVAPGFFLTLLFVAIGLGIFYKDEKKQS